MNNLAFYKKYLSFESDLELPSAKALQAPSPFGDGALTVSADGIFTCKATGKTGGPAEFIIELYPGVTKSGAQLIVNEDTRLASRSLEGAGDLIEAFRGDKPLVKVAARKLGVSIKELLEMPLFMDKRGFRYYYVTDYSPSRTPLSLATFTPERALRLSQGIQRTPKQTTQRVWLTENPVIAFLIEKNLGETAFCWPSQRELRIFDYKTLLAGKDVVALHGELSYTYEDSFYPIFEELRRSTLSFADLRIDALIEGKSLAEWLSKKANREQLRESALISTKIQPITRDQYTQYIRQDDTKDVHMAQCQARGYFFYGTFDGYMAQSWPLNLDSMTQTETNFKLRFIQATRFNNEIRLSADRILNIGQSVGQYTPRNTFKAIRSLLDDYIYFGDEQMKTMIALWVMGTYVFRLFPAYPYLHINAPKNSGKTTLLDLIVKCSFNGVMASRITSASLIQTVSDTLCTLCLDEFEQQTSGQNNSAHMQVLNSGYKRGGNYRRLRGSNTDAMDLYSPKVYASVDEIKTGTLASRTLKVPMSRKPAYTPLQSWDETNSSILKRINEILNGGYALGLYHHMMIEYLLERLDNQVSLPSGIELQGRLRELVTPLVIMAQLVDLNAAEGELKVERELLSILEALMFPDMQQERDRRKILANQLLEWSQNPAQVQFTIKDEMTWIANGMWENTSLATHFEGNKKSMISWLKSISDSVKRKTIHIPGVGTESCTGFPKDLILNAKPFREWFSPESSSDAA